MQRTTRHLVPATILLAAATAPAQAQDAPVDFPISCNAAAQAEFNRGIALLHHMTYPAARETFEHVGLLDPQCAMAHWGVAMTLFQPLWPTRPGPAELQRGWREVEAARALEPRTERERMLIDAVALFFAEPESTDYWSRVRGWEQAMARVHDAFPRDLEIAAFYALAHLAVAPVASVSDANAVRAAELLMGVHAQNAEHPGAMHYIVHATDVSGREHTHLDIVRRYADSAPRNPHALHMPTHIYTRLGDWAAVISGNLLAAAAALEHPAGEFVWDEFPHAIEYLVYAYLQQAADDAAAVQLERLRDTPRLQPTLKTAFHLASTAARYALERRAWRDAMALRERQPPTLDWDRFTWPEAITWFAKGLGAAHEGSLDEARAAAERIDQLERAAAAAGEALFARNIRILGLGVRAWIAHAARDPQAAVALMREAAELEESTPKHAVTPAPTLPARELLGDMLMEQGRPMEALDAYRESLEAYPGRFNGLLGAARAARSSGDTTSARIYYAELLDRAGAGTRRALLDEARRFGGR